MKTASVFLAAALFLTGSSGAASANDPSLSSVTVSAQSGALTYGTGNSATYTVTVARRAGSTTASGFSVTLSQTATLPAGAAASFVPSTLVFATGELSKTSTLTISTINSTPPGATTIKVKATQGDSYVKGNGSLSVLQATATVKANDKTRSYGDPNPALDATVTGEVPGDPIHYTLGTAATQFSGVQGGPYSITVTLGSNPNYVVTPINGSLTVQPVFATVKANGKSKTYGDPNPALDATVTGQVPGGDAIQYSLSTTATPLSDVPGSPYSINVTLGSNPNYSIKIPADNGVLTVEPKFATVKANSKTKTYGDVNPPFDAVVTGEVPGGEPVHYTLSTAATQLSSVAGSPYAIDVTLGANPSYSVKIPADNGTLTIGLRAANVKANDKIKIYGDAVPPLDATVTNAVPGGDPIHYTLATAATKFSNVVDSPFAITVTLGSNPNYSVTPTNGALAIGKCPASVSANSKTKTYGDPNPPFDATVLGEAVGGDPVDYTLTTTATQFSNVSGGPYPISVVLGPNPNYEVEIKASNAGLTILQRDAHVVANDKNNTYGDPIPALDASVTGQVTGGDPVLFTLATTATPLSGANGNPYPITVTLGSNPNYSVAPTNGALTVLRRPATVKATDLAKLYGGVNPTLAATVTNEVKGGDLIHYTLSTTAVQCSDVAHSPYPITVTPGANPNYLVTPTDGALTVLARVATVTANNATRVYGDPNPVFDATVFNEVKSCEPIHYTLSTTATPLSAVSGGPYAITVNLGANPNYVVTPSNGTLTILLRPATVTANDKSKTYGDDNPSLDATVTGEVSGGDLIQYTLSTTALKLSNVAGSPYSIDVALGANPNYSVTPTNGALTIQPKLAMVKANCKTKTYGEDNPPLDATVTGEVPGGDPVHYSLSTPAVKCSNVGAYAIEVTLGSNPNYSVKVPADNCVLTIEPKFATVKANAKTKAYGDENPPLDATVTGEVPGCDPIHYALSTPAVKCSNVSGSPYPIEVTLGSNPNYSVKVPADNGTLTIEPKFATVKAKCMTKIYGDDNPVIVPVVTGEVLGCEPIHFTLSTTAVKCSNVGVYPIEVTLGSNPNYSVKVPADNCVLTILPRPATVTANNKSKTYGDDNPLLDATVTGEAAGCEPIHYTLSTKAVKCSDVAGSPYPITVTLDANPNYSLHVGSGILTVACRPVTITANNVSRTYGSTDPLPPATVTGEAAGCEPVHYTLTTIATQCSSVSGSPYPINVTLGLNPNYCVTVIVGELTIEPRFATVKANDKTKAYGDPNPVLDATLTGEVPGCDPINYSLSTPATQCSPVAGSPYPINVTLGSNPNYSVKVPADNGVLTITPRLASVRVSDQTKVYGDPDPLPHVTVTGEAPGCEPIHFTLGAVAAVCKSVAGSPYPIVVVAGANPNYNVTVFPGALTVLPRIATVKANSKTKIYGDPNPPLDATVTNEAPPPCDPVCFSLSTPTGQFSNVAGSPYPINVTLCSNPNYSVKVPADNGTLTITPRPIALTATDKTKTYGDENPPFEVTVSGGVESGDALKYGGGMVRGFGGADPIQYVVNTPATKCSDVAGSPYPIIVKPGSNPNYDIAVNNGRLTIQQRPATVTANAKTKTYGDPNPALDATVGNEATGCEPVRYTLNTTATQCSDVVSSPLAITVSLGANPNYSVTVTDGGLTIQARPVTLRLPNLSKIYGDPLPQLDVSVSGDVVADDAVDRRRVGPRAQAAVCEPVHFTPSTTATQCSDVGRYPITAKVEPNANYDVTVIEGSLDIVTRKATVKANDKSKIYGDENPALDATVIGVAVGCESIHYQLNTPATNSSDVPGPYPIIVTLGDNPNYDITPTNAGLTIQPRSLTIEGQSAPLTKVYGDPDPPLEFVVEGVTITGTRDPGETVAGSPYAIHVAPGAAGPNYVVKFGEAFLVITPAPLTVTANAGNKVYGELPDPPLTCSVSGLKRGDQRQDVLSGEMTRAPGETVAGGPYAIQQGNLATSTNYALQFTGNQFQITTRSVEVTASAQTKTFGDSDLGLTYAITKGSLAFSDAFTGALGRAPGETVQGGPYAILQNTLALGPNYALTYVGANFSITPAQAAAQLTFTPTTQQYSDVVRFTATVPNGFLNSTQAVSAVTVSVGANVVGSIALSPSGTSLTGSLSVALLEPAPFATAPGAAPGSYSVAGVMGSVDPNYLVAAPQSGTLLITHEDARATYTGTTAVTTMDAQDTGASAQAAASGSGGSNKATITLSATIQDISATTEAAGDVSFGDVRKATVTFVDRGNGDAVIATVPVGLVTTGDTKTGTATFDWLVDIGTAASKQLTVGVIVNGNYARNSSVDNMVVTVGRQSSGWMTGPVHIAFTNTAGLCPGDGSGCDVNYDLKYKNNGGLQGGFSAAWKKGGHSFQLSASAVTSLVLQATNSGGTATLTGKASLVDATSGSVTIDDNATLLVTLADMGEPGRSDWVSITVWNKKGGLWFASNWNGTRTVQTTITNGNLQFHSGGHASATRAIAKGDDSPQPASASIPLEYALMQNFPNPFTDGTSIRFDLPQRSRVTLTVYDLMGREVASLVDEAIDPGRHTATWAGRNRAGGPAEAGVYFVRMIAVAESGTGRFRWDKRIALVR